MSSDEFSREVDLRSLPTKPISLAANAEERAALARRFGLISVDAFTAEIMLKAEGTAVEAAGTLKASIVQSCAISGENLPVTIDEPLALRFLPERTIEEEEVELEADELDEIPYTGSTIDLGEAIAQSLALAIDPYACGPDADRVRQEAGLSDQAATGPFAALAALKKP